MLPCLFWHFHRSTESAVFRFFTHSRAITPFMLAIGSSRYLRRDTNPRVAPSCYYGSLDLTTYLEGDAPALSSRHFFRLSRRRHRATFSPLVHMRGATGISVVETFVSALSFKPLRQLPRVLINFTHVFRNHDCISTSL